MKWELKWTSSWDEAQDFALDGWEMCGAGCAQVGIHYYYFKRPL